MLRRKRPANPPVEHLGNEFAWKVHEAIQGWTASVDAKTSIVLVVQTAVAGASTHALISKEGDLHGARGLHLGIAVVAVTLLVLSVACALWVVFPRLQRRRTGLAASGLIFFGDLRDRDTDDIAPALAGLTDEEERRQLASQLKITSQVAWRKHAWLQRSLATFALGAVLLVISYVAF